MKNIPTRVPAIPLVLYDQNQLLAKTAFNTIPGQGTPRHVAEFLPTKTGRYRAVASFPDGTQQESRFMVYSENLEETEVATDSIYLKRLCESSGGRLMQPEELGACLAKIRDAQVEATPNIKLISLWDQTWAFYWVGLLFGIDWFLRRRWGLC